MAVILNIDADHLDYFGTLDNVIASFRKFAARTTGTLIVNMEDENAPLAVRGLSGPRVITYGLQGDWDWTAKNVGVTDGSYGTYDLYHEGGFIAHVRLGVPGAHNVSNSLAAAAAATLCGASPAQIVEGLESFHGAGRRLRISGHGGGRDHRGRLRPSSYRNQRDPQRGQGHGLPAGLGHFPALHLFPHRPASGRVRLLPVHRRIR